MPPVLCRFLLSFIEDSRQEAEAKAEKAGNEARESAIAEWEAELTERVQEAIGDRRAQAIKALGREETIKGSRVAWFGDLLHGSRVLLTYNSDEGPLTTAAAIRVHLGTDNWYKEQIEVSQLPK